jgi:lysophospholipase L1-like esterase
MLFIPACGQNRTSQNLATGDHWVTTWATAQQIMRGAPLPQRPAPSPGTSAAQQPAPPPSAPPKNLAIPPMLSSLNNQTVRMIIRASVGGSRVRVRLSNAFGSQPLLVGAARIALHGKDSAIIPDSDRALTFGGKPSCTIGPGVVTLSDPVDLNVAPLSELAVSLYLPGNVESLTSHLFGLHTAYISKDGDFTGQATISDATTTLSYYWLTGVDVLAPANVGAIVALGDSITDGHGSFPDSNRNWPSIFAARLQRNKSTANLAVANVGISGNQLLRDGAGVSALARFDRDVLVQPGVKYVMLMEGINDITLMTRPTAEPKSEAAITDELIAGYIQIVGRARAHGLRIIGCTLTPFDGSRAFTDKGETVRTAVNQWIRSSGAFDAVVDFDAATRDPKNPKRFRQEFQAGDFLHPSEEGYQAMADAIDFALFTLKSSSATPKRQER